MSEEWRVRVGEAARYWPEWSWLTGAEEVLALAGGRSGEEAQAVRESTTGTPNGAFLARAGDLARARWFLWAWTTLAAGERLGSIKLTFTLRLFERDSTVISVELLITARNP